MTGDPEPQPGAPGPAGSLASGGRENSFDALRLMLASCVLYSHAYLLGGFGTEGFAQFTRGQVELGTIGVLGFFGLSGYLVSKSYANDPSIHVYLGKRIRRIFPGFLVCLLVCAFALGPLTWWLRNGDLAQYPVAEAAGFFWRNAGLAITQWSIGALLEGMPYSDSFNGSLWTLLPEFACYLVVGILGLLCLHRERRGLLVLLLLYLIQVAAVRQTQPQVAALALFPAPLILIHHIDIYIAFVSGMCCFAFADMLKLDGPLALSCAVGLLVVLRLGGFVLVGPPLLVLLCLSIGASIKFPIRHDVSYGMYIYGFPVQQLMVAGGVGSLGVGCLFAGSALVTACLAMASWLLVERRWLHREPRSA